MKLPDYKRNTYLKILVGGLIVTEIIFIISYVVAERCIPAPAVGLICIVWSTTSYTFGRNDEKINTLILKTKYEALLQIVSEMVNDAKMMKEAKENDKDNKA